MDGTKVKLVDLDPFSNEYKDVLMLFGNETVKKVCSALNQYTNTIFWKLAELSTYLKYLKYDQISKSHLS